MKPAKYIEAAEVFSGTSVKITWEGRGYLGGALGSHEFEYTHVQGKVLERKEEVKCLAKIALTQLHAAYAAFTHGLISRWAYAVRVSIISPDDALQPLADTITQHLIPALINQPVPCKAMRDLLALPSHSG